jgi:hypothetical protein
MYSPLTPVYRSLCLLAICILFTSAFSACSSGGSGGGAEQQSGDPNAFPPGSGGVVFGITWQRPSANAQAPRFAPSFNSCVDFGIDTISATVSNGTTTVASGSWPCSLHGGSVLAVPAGTNYTLRVDGISAGLTTWRGLTSSVIVNASQITNAGTIVMNYIGTDATQPTVTSLGPKSNPAITTSVPATDRVAIVFDSPMAISTITTNNIALKLIDNTPISGTISYNAGSNTAAFTPSTTLAYDTQYVIEVISCVTPTCITDAAGNQLATDYTNTFTTESAPIAVPGAPSGVTATPANGQVTLDWLASNGSTSYNIYYLTSAGVTTTTGTLIPDARAPFVHLGRTNNTTYHYIVTAVNSFGESPISAEVNATPAFPAGNPLPPATLTVTSLSGQNIVTWPAVAGATSYNLYWSTSFITFGKYAADNVIRDATSSFTHTGLTDGVAYCYIVTAINASGESADSMQACGGMGIIQINWL